MKKLPKRLLPLSIAELDIPNRVYARLKDNDIWTIKELVSHSYRSLRKCRQLGVKSVNLIQEKLYEIGLCLSSDKERNRKIIL